MTGKNSEQTFSFKIVSCLLAALLESGATVGNKHYALMAKIDGSKTQSGYEHVFRAVKKRAQEIKEQIEKGEIDIGASASTPKGRKASSKSVAPSTGRAEKRGRKAATEDDGESDKSPTKKMKLEQASEGEEEEELR